MPDRAATKFNHELARVITDTSVHVETMPGVTPGYFADLDTRSRAP